jgi:hypothetical protein
MVKMIFDLTIHQKKKNDLDIIVLFDIMGKKLLHIDKRGLGFMVFQFLFMKLMMLSDF